MRSTPLSSTTTHWSDSAKLLIRLLTGQVTAVQPTQPLGSREINLSISFRCGWQLRRYALRIGRRQKLGHLPLIYLLSYLVQVLLRYLDGGRLLHHSLDPRHCVL